MRLGTYIVNDQQGYNSVFFFFFFLFFFFCFVLFCFVLFCFVLFCFVLFCFVLFCFVLFTVLADILFCFELFYQMWHLCWDPQGDRVFQSHYFHAKQPRSDVHNVDTVNEGYRTNSLSVIKVSLYV